MSESRIRSEAVAESAWAQPFLPPAVRDDDDPFGDGADFGAMLAGAGRAMTALFGLPVTVRAGRPATSADGSAPPRVAPALAGLLATLRLGGDPARAGAFGGVALARHAAAIATALDAVAAAEWPSTSRLPRFDVDIACSVPGGSIDGHATILAPPRPLAPPPEPILALRHALLGLPMRIRVELAAEMRLVGSLLPLCPGQVLALAPPPEMPLILGRHCIGRAIVTPLPDGRQQAELVAMGIEPVGDRG